MLRAGILRFDFVTLNKRERSSNYEHLWTSVFQIRHLCPDMHIVRDVKDCLVKSFAVGSTFRFDSGLVLTSTWGVVLERHFMTFTLSTSRHVKWRRKVTVVFLALTEVEEGLFALSKQNLLRLNQCIKFNPAPTHFFRDLKVRIGCAASNLYISSRNPV